MPILLQRAPFDRTGADWPVRLPGPMHALELRPGATGELALDGATALIAVQEGMLASGDRFGPRALPGEWICARKRAAFAYANPSRAEGVRGFVVTLPAGSGGESVVQRYFSDDQKADRLCTVAVRDGAHHALSLGVDAAVYTASLGRWSTVLHDLEPGRGAAIIVVAGDASANNQTLECGDAAFIYHEEEVRLSGGEGADVILVDLPLATSDSDGPGRNER